MSSGSGVYFGEVVHQRMRPRKHRLRYKVFSLLLDLDDLEPISERSIMFGFNRPAFFSVHDADHGDGQDIRRWVERQLMASGLGESSHQILMLTYPRILGDVFNPLTVFFCYKPDGNLGAVIHEVHNTFKVRHAYTLPVTAGGKEIVRQRSRKEFYVSPFIPMDCSYDFRIQPPGDVVRVVIREEDHEGLLLAAAFSGDRRPLTDVNLLKAAFKYPLMTLKVVIGIHWEAVRLFLKGAPYFPRGSAEKSSKTGSTGPHREAISQIPK